MTPEQVLALPGFRDCCTDASIAVHEDRCLAVRDDHRSGMTPEPTVQDETADHSDDSPADGIQRDHADQQECEHHEGGAALPIAVSPCDHHSRNAD
jgi:hypothetical protein